MKLILVIAALSFFATCSYGQLRCWECNNARTNEQCLSTGRLSACVEEEAICEDQIRHEQYGEIVIIEKRCKQRHACNNNVDQNLRPAFPIQCSVGQSSPTSVCRCCCSTNGCNRDLLTCWRGYPTQAPPVAANPCADFPKTPENGIMQCTGNKEPGTYCDFTCHQNFYIDGQVRLTCLDSSRWDHPEPKCKEQTCSPESFFVGNGSVTCTNGNKLRSRCRFSCNPDYGLEGNVFAECQPRQRPGSKRGLWSASAPTCRPLICPMQGPIDHGSFSCTQGNRFGSVCTWRCNGDFQIFPPGFEVNVCQETGDWNRPFPCCTLPCPPFAVVDLMIILDSSSSVGLANWMRMTDFVANLLQRFRLQPDAAQFSVFRYNADVDEATALFFNNFTDDRDAFIRAFRQIPYDGSGTNTGRALVYGALTALPIGNRREAQDIVVLITDGNSQDRIQIPGRVLRQTGADIRIIPVRPPDNSTIDLEPLVNVAGSPDKVIQVALERGFAALDVEFVNSLAAGLCPPPCSNPFHDHGPTPERIRPFIPSVEITG